MGDIMKKENMLTVMESELEKALTDFDFAMDWNTKKHTIELFVVIFAENKELSEIEDDEGVVSEEEVIEFEDSILFYDITGSTPDSEEYLAVIPFDRKKGMSREWLKAFASHLNDVLVDGQDDLLTFLSNEEEEVFELNWSQEAFEQHMASVEDKTMIAYPRF